ncbi:MAG: hypothetical protein IJC10_02870 [Clostridia bacterium]|nr:hypothetical protein [Clostridia bacterium]
MCGICRTVNCIRRRLCGCGCNRNNGRYSYDYNGCNECGYNYDRCGCNSRYTEPRMNVVCANQRDDGFTPCCDDNDCNCHKHHHDRCCD